MRQLSIQLHSGEWLGSWRQATSRLLLRVPECPRLGLRVSLRIQFDDQPVSATVTGTAVGVESLGNDCRIELAPDPDGLRAIRLLSAAARGEPIRFLERAPRYQAKVPVFVLWNGERFLTSTVSISDGGCALRWNGQTPTIGQRMDLRIGSGSQAHGVRGVVCWSEAAGATSKVGLRVLALNGARQVWRMLVEEAVHAGATGG
jgi:hypothetical protein